MKTPRSRNQEKVPLRMGGALSGKEIWDVLRRPKDPLEIMPPLYDKRSLLNANVIDLRLGQQFIFMRKAELSALTFRNMSLKKLDIVLRRFYETICIGFNNDLVLHPGELVLGATFEYIKLPNDLMAYIIGRSSWGRLGLIIATAIVIHPGFKGCPTLELINDGNIPLHLFPEAPIPIAQITFHWVGPGQEQYKGRYSENQWVGPTGPGYSKIHSGEAFSRWIEFREKKASHPNAI